jgi:hypothetical protein
VKIGTESAGSLPVTADTTTIITIITTTTTIVKIRFPSRGALASGLWERLECWGWGAD